MLNVNGVAINFDGQNLFSNVNLQFLPGNCYGIIGANGAGKSTFIKILSGELEPTSGSVVLDPKRRMSVLKQNQSLFDDYTVLDTVIIGNQRLYDCGKEKDAIYEKEDFTDEDGIRAAELEEEFAELGGWEAESDAGRILQGLGVDVSLHQSLMRDVDPRLKVKVLLAQALFGHPDVILLDEPTAFLDMPNRYELCTLLRRLAHDEGKCIFFSTHELDIALTLCDAVALIDPPRLHLLPTDEMIRSGHIERLFDNGTVAFDASTRTVTVRR